MKQNRNSHELSIAMHQNIKEKKYWLKKLTGQPERSHFPYDCKKTSEKNSSVIEKFDFTGELFSNLMRLSKNSAYALHMIMTAAVTVLINKYTGKDDILVGSPIYKQDVEGELVNTVLPLRNHLNASMTFKELLNQVKQTITEAIVHYSYPLEMLTENLNMPIMEEDFPLFDTVVFVENVHDKRYLEHIHVNMIFSFFKTERVITGSIEYNPSRYENTTIKQVIAHFIKLVQEIFPNMDSPISHIKILSEAERRQLLYDFNKTEAKYPKDKTIHQLFEEQVGNTPDNIALVLDGICLTYRELNQKANRLARILRAKGVKPDSIVGIMMDPSIEMIVGLLCILKAGGAFLPIDPEYPENRIKSMLDFSGANILLTKSIIFRQISFSNLQGETLKRMDLHLSAPRPPIKDLDSIQFPDRSLVDYEKYSHSIAEAMVKHSISLQATRGCPYNCAYCCRVWPRTFVTRSAENIFEEVLLYYDMGVRRFAFYDDIFNLDIENSKRFFQLIADNDMDIHLFFPTGFRGDILTKEYIDAVVKAGAVNIALSMETASPRMQKLIHKNLKIERFRENVKYICEKYPQVILELQLMHGFPTETEEEAKMSLDFVKSIKWIHFPYLHVLKIHSNTDMETIALENGISPKAIKRSRSLAYHELPETIPFDKNFTLKFQAEFLNDYFLQKERLLHVLPYQMKVLTEDEIIQKYDSYLPTEINNFDDLLEFVGITREELGVEGFMDDTLMAVSHFNQKLRNHFPIKKAAENALKILLLDLTQFFSSDVDMLFDVLEPPLGLMYLVTHLNRHFGEKVDVKIAKSRVDFDSFAELKNLVNEFNPDLIGLRGMTFYKELFHQTVELLHQWGIDIPIIAGGPYATSDFETVLMARNIDLVVVGEGEETLREIVEKMIENNNKMPGEEILKEIKGIIYVPHENTVNKGFARQIIMLDEITRELSGQPVENLEPVNRSTDLAYNIFTSGSTGEPKGVMIEHQSLVNLCTWHNRYYSVTSRDKATKYAGFSFDASVWEIFPYLIGGASIHLLEDEIKLDMHQLNRYFEDHQITIGFLPTQVGEQFMKMENRSLRKLLVGGDKLHTFNRASYEIYNNYGPTENTVVATSCRITENVGNIPIGKPIHNNRIYILNKYHNQIQPVGIPGELCIAGDSLARGYCNNPEGTLEKFVGNPLVAAGKLYRTGDLTRWLPDGNIEFLGRIDQQVKIRGFRIECGEIESQLLDHDKIKEAAVIVQENEGGDKYLCAYWVPVDTGEVNPEDTSLTPSELKEYISMELQDYMIPSYFIQLENIPLTSNGKVDRRALAELKPGTPGKNYVEPASEQEKIIADVWKEVLGLRKVGIHDNFFDLGGNSINIIKVADRLKERLNRELPIVDMFEYTTISSLAGYFGREEIEKGVSNHHRAKLLNRGKTDKMQRLQMRKGVQNVWTK